jgi:hypothetical protein
LVHNSVPGNLADLVKPKVAEVLGALADRMEGGNMRRWVIGATPQPTV